ncbi:GntR family transcriptional regulator [Pelagirhabdus alkalitolerans]|uniref:GntR family transcriptional regulator n=1 Tax=Pelagirhabdus alkalitolerans TaxID=1612202 RepID=A0A1G6GXN6_9BACI|nr:GntR family transcriptional regulator [Pelagirhabdus alkalitolerans]SDB86704.1 GntR family transcriptional regulator [Pelagirhabdus alkalitolerans]
MFELDSRSRDPIYQQLIDQFKTLIIKGVIAPHEKLPSVRNLAQEMSINPNTIQKAYRELERQGFIYSIKAKGSFASEATDHEKSALYSEIEQKLMELIEEAIYLGVSRQKLHDLIDASGQEEKE